MLGDIERVLEALNSAGVRYLVVGGVAVVLHGHLRTTADLDLVVQLEHDNVSRAMGALAGLGYRPRAPTLEVDLFVTEPFGFDDVYARALKVPLENTIAWVISLPDLIALKSQARRPQDLEDIEALRALDADDTPETAE